MTDQKKTTDSRRRLLKTVAAGGGAIIAGKTLPENWSKPAIEAMVLPAHAQTSGTFSGSSSTTIAGLGSDSRFARAMNALLPEAQAGIPTYRIDWCVIPINDTQAEVTFLVYPDVVPPPFADLYTGTATVGQKSELASGPGCSNIVDAGQWLQQLGLINEASAFCTAYVTLSGLKTGDPFDFDDDCSGAMLTNEPLATGSQCPTPIECGDPK